MLDCPLVLCHMHNVMYTHDQRTLWLAVVCAHCASESRVDVELSFVVLSVCIESVSVTHGQICCIHLVLHDCTVHLS